MSKRVGKLQDYVAHSGRVLCARLGEKSGQVLATGGEDKKVNIWKVGKPNAMMSLQGHTSSVESLVFDKQEEVLVVGCAGGSMQVWNLEYRKMAGTLSGHRTSCGAVEFHPYGEFFASGSADTNLKIWDLRRKSCIQTYKGHTGPITSIRFSPHGRWVATGGQDNQVKLWDLTAGKLMRDLDVHKGPITSIAFHPKEYLLATGSADKTTKLWSLESFQTVASTELGATPVQAVKFWTEDSSLVSASHDALRVYSTDSLCSPQDAMEVDWKGLQDLRLCASEERLIAITAEGTQLGIWVADLRNREAAAVKGPGYGRLHGRPPSSVVKSQAPRYSQRPLSDVEDHDAEQQSLDRAGSGQLGEVRASGQDQIGQQQEGLRPGAYPVSLGPALLQPGSPTTAADAAATPHAAVGMPTSGPPAREPRLPDPAERRAVGSRPPSTEFFAAGAGSSSPVVARSQEASPEPASSPLAAASPPAASPSARPIATPGRDPASGQLPPQPQRQAVSLEQISQLSTQHPQMMGVLNRRADQIRRLKELWARGNIASINSVLNMPQDHAVFCDFARAIMRKQLESALNLDACQALLPILRDLLGSKYDDFVITALQFIEVLLQNFSRLIADTRHSCANIPERQLDLPREERLRKCNACHDHFREIYRLLPETQIGSRFSGFRQTLNTFLHSC